MQSVPNPARPLFPQGRKPTALKDADEALPHRCIALAAAAVVLPALAENCADTGFVALAATDCRGAFVGSLTGNPTDSVALAAARGGTWRFAGKSDDSGSGPFSSNPQTAFGGVLVFDTPISGDFVVGLVAGNQFSYYRFPATGAVASLTFDTTEGVATTIQGKPLALSHAALYVSGVPEASAFAMMLAGLLSVCALAARRRV